MVRSDVCGTFCEKISGPNNCLPAVINSFLPFYLRNKFTSACNQKATPNLKEMVFILARLYSTPILAEANLITAPTIPCPSAVNSF